MFSPERVLMMSCPSAVSSSTYGGKPGSDKMASSTSGRENGAVARSGADSMSWHVARSERSSLTMVPCCVKVSVMRPGSPTIGPCEKSRVPVSPS